MRSYQKMQLEDQKMQLEDLISDIESSLQDYTTERENRELAKSLGNEIKTIILERPLKGQK